MPGQAWCPRAVAPPAPSLERVIGSWHLLAPARTLHEYQLTYFLTRLDT